MGFYANWSFSVEYSEYDLLKYTIWFFGDI